MSLLIKRKFIQEYFPNELVLLIEEYSRECPWNKELRELKRNIKYEYDINCLYFVKDRYRYSIIDYRDLKYGRYTYCTATLSLGYGCHAYKFGQYQETRDDLWEYYRSKLG